MGTFSVAGIDIDGSPVHADEALNLSAWCEERTMPMVSSVDLWGSTRREVRQITWVCGMCNEPRRFRRDAGSVDEDPNPACVVAGCDPCRRWVLLVRPDLYHRMLEAAAKALRSR